MNVLNIKDVERLSDVDLFAGLFGKSVDLAGANLLELFGMSSLRDEVRDCMDSALRYKLLCARELVARAMFTQTCERVAFDAPDSVRAYLRLKLGGLAFECFWVIYLDSQNRIQAAEELFRGTLTQTSVYPREIVVGALKREAAAVILAHNHPSGIAMPSRADEVLTQTIKAALSLVDVRVLDHFIVTTEKCASMAEMGLV